MSENNQPPKFTNELIHEKSPYLLQHAHNPVNWLPWGEKAFAMARSQNKPILLSSGYSTCHWCHVMERESFENEEIAAVMNEQFICVKLDREERPDIDLVYMTYVQAATGGGGWPLNVFLTPELKPFFGGTYYAPESRGRIGWKDLLREISKAWNEDREGVMERARQSISKLQTHIESETATKGEPQVNEVLDKAYDSLSGSFDYHEGGFGSAPKFPRPSALHLLFRLSRHYMTTESGQSSWATEMALKTLRAMANGGLRDHLGGGFHRYSVDSYWHVPHYEKMLYDQAQLLPAYAEAYSLTKGEFYATIARQTMDYVAREMTHAEGGFYSAEDADSYPTADAKVKTEGAFYVWTAAEVDGLLGKRDGGIFRYAYGVRKDGNARPESDPHGELKGLNTLFRAYSAKKTAEYFKLEMEEVNAILNKGRQVLLDTRVKRPHPHLDDKIITAWNGLMIAGLAHAAAALDEPSYLGMAVRAADFIKLRLTREQGQKLLRSWRADTAGAPAFSIDYVCLIHGLIELHQATLDVRWLQWALQLQGELDALAWDAEHGGWFSVHTDQPDSIMRIKEDYDGAEPSPNSLGAMNLARLAALTGDETFAQRAREVLNLFHQTLLNSPSAVPVMVQALDFLEKGKQQIVIAGDGSDESFQSLLKTVRAHFLPHAVLMHADGAERQAFHSRNNQALAAMGPVDGKAAVYVCQNYTCQTPVTTDEALAKLLVS
jgi:uncharacterized protein